MAVASNNQAGKTKTKKALRPLKSSMREHISKYTPKSRALLRDVNGLRCANWHVSENLLQHVSLQHRVKPLSHTAPLQHI
jgi:hypothetical protein